MSLTLHKFGPHWGVSDPSPFCVKLESFLRLNDIKYTLGDFDMKKTIGQAPKKKIPFVEFENGERMGDSSFIIQHLCQHHGIDMESTLTDKQRATSYAYRRMIDEAMYFCLIYSRWGDDVGWTVLEPEFFGEVPQFVRGIISAYIRKGVIKKAHEQGTARHSQEDIYAMACRDLDSLFVLLGDDRWFFGAKKPGLLDLWVHASVINIIKPPIENAVKGHCLTLGHLCDHADRFQRLVYPEFCEAA